jgi:ADP-heptose:LPS heptosyltransferase
VLVARLDNAGDVLLSGPAVRAVAEAGRPVCFVCGPRGWSAAELLPGVDEVLTWHAPWIEPEPMPVRRRHADALVEAVARRGVREALILGSSHQSPLPLALLLRWAGVSHIAAVSHEHAGSLLDVRIEGDPDQHEVERNLAVAAALGFARPADDRLAVDLALDLALDLAGAGVEPDLAEPGPGGLADLGALDEYVVVHPGSSAPARTLTASRWREVVAHLAGRGTTVLVTGSEEERRLTAAVAGNHPLVNDLGGRTSLRRLARVLAGAAAVATGNTGPLHLAAAVGTPVVAVFPPTVPLERWRPWRVPHVVLGDHRVACAGCRSRTCPLPRQMCLDGVTPGAVAVAADELARLPRRPPDQAVSR